MLKKNSIIYSTLIIESYSWQKSVNILDEIIWLKCAWDSVKPKTIQKCFARCGFNKATCSDQEEENVIDSNITAFVETCGVSWEEYTNFDHDLSTNRSFEEDWETSILEKAKAQSSSEDALEKHAEEKDEEEDEESEMMVDKPTISAGTAIHYLDEFSDFSLSQQSSELLELITKSKNTIEGFIYSSSRFIQAKLSDFIKNKSTLYVCTVLV